MYTTITDANGNALPMGNAYKYDQLNRLIEANSYTSVDNTFGSGGDPKYHNAFTYDANGNILTQKRHDQNNTVIDDLSYKYQLDAQSNPLRNRLYHLDDQVAASTFNDDLDDMGTFVSNANDINVVNNYKYDAEGRLIQDEQEEIAEIQWRVDGKVKKIVRTPTSLRKNLTFDYDAMGNRIAKHIELLDGTRLSSTYYLLDAQGNPLAMYELDYAASSFELTERQIYGSARLGSLKTKVDVFGTAYNAYSDVITTHAIGDRNYELSNHLGNVLTVVSDKLHSVDDGNGAVASYTADLVMSCDYSPFGVTLEGRGVEGSYRFGFNSMEADDEIKGDGNSYDFGARMYDSRVGRWLTIDPLAAMYSDISDYAFCANSPILFIDLDGKKFVNPYTNDFNELTLKKADAETALNEWLKANPEAKKRQINEYKNTSGYNSITNEFNTIQKKFQTIESLIFTLKTVSPEEYEYFENLKDSKGNEMLINVYIEDDPKKMKPNNYGNTTGMAVFNEGDVVVPSCSAGGFNIFLNEKNLVLDKDGAILRVLYGATFQTFSNELGDIKYWMEKVNDKASYDLWYKTVDDEYGKYLEKEGAGLFSYEYEEARMKDFNNYKVKEGEKKESNNTISTGN